LLTWCSHLVDGSYPKGLIIAFALKNKLAGGSAEQNGAQEPANDDANACDGGSNSSENMTKENEQKVPENIKTDEENNGEEVDGDNGSESTVIKTEEEKSSEDPNEKEEVKEKPNPAASKDDKNVVLREDLKAVFERFGIVKVLRFSFSLCSCFLFLWMSLYAFLIAEYGIPLRLYISPTLFSLISLVYLACLLFPVSIIV